MVKVAVMLANGFEEIEALAPVDIFRRADFQCDMIGLTSIRVEGSHAIKVEADSLFDGDLSQYDLIVLPGGMPGSINLRDDDRLIAELQKAVANGKRVAAICAAPIVLDRAGLLAGRRYTCFPGKEADVASGIHVENNVVVDGPIITSRGAGTSLDFAYKLVDLLGGDGQGLARVMVHKN
ncbi:MULTISPECIES: DJ-1 family glyoxalase III [Streptococcus]|uniref:DJ-1/PfpI family protein n=1 Tax=Streptococcus iners subsp. hyiners TaxID=3028083 RepID=A0AA96VH45_9STRE|nr:MULTISPECIES: DJ-1 family glyoxalase III [Streptococcus]MCK4029251.1 DJ-1/PfpI family protein [Streptococcus suis]WNY49720.1 DJ-1/PfpI family protein [Streptococcus sp. 29892]